MTKQNRQFVTHHHQSGFTLIELVVVVGIILLLAAVLIPAVGKARITSKVTATTAQLKSISMACENYATIFNGQYPGPIKEDLWNGTTNPAQSFSSSQALLVSLTRFNVSSTAGVAWDNARMGDVITVANADGLGNPLRIASNPAYPCMDYSTRRNFDAATIKPNEISESLFSGAAAPPAANLRNLPCFVDMNWKSPLPILYFRAARKFDSSIPNLRVIRQNYPGGINLGSYYADANRYFTVQANVNAFRDLDTANMQTFLIAPAGQDASPGLIKDLTDTVGGFNVPKGGFVLIAPGPDRLYGVDNSNNTDDIVVAGGN